MYALEKNIKERLQELEKQLHTAQQLSQAARQEPSETTMPQPQLWFNPKTSRWISTSCRTYREILRDQKQSEQTQKTTAELGKGSKKKRKRKDLVRHKSRRPLHSSSESDSSPRSASPVSARADKRHFRSSETKTARGSESSLFERYGF